MSAGADENVRSSSELTMGSDKIAKDMERLNSVITEAARGSISQVNSEAYSLSGWANQLQELVNKFKLS